MGFNHTLGPDSTRSSSAWGNSRCSKSKYGTRTNNSDNNRNKSSGLKPKIVHHTQRGAKYPSSFENADDLFGTNKNKRVNKKEKRKPSRTVRLSSSTARPKPKPKVAPPRAGAWNQKKASSTIVTTPFKRFYDRGDIPICIGHGAKRRVHWKVKPESLDYHHYLPLFFEGLRETQEPYTFLALAGVKDLLDRGGDKVLPVVPQIILPLKAALNTKNRKTIGKVLIVLQYLVKSGPYVGEALVPYYRQLLPVFNMVLLLDKRKNLGDRIDYGQQKKEEDLINLVHETLEILHDTAGPDGYVNLKFLIPTFEYLSN